MHDDGRVLVIAHLSDTHFGGRWAPAERARRVLDHLSTLDPPVDVVLVTGDIAEHGTPEEYAEAARVLGAWAGPAPMFACIGNHDVREGYAAWRGLPADVPQNQAHRVAGALFVMLDSMVPAQSTAAGEPGERIDYGVLAPETLDFLEDQLSSRAAGERAFVCLHHPPEPIHLGLMDPIRLRNSAELAAVLDRHRDVVAVLVGHAHSACTTAFASMSAPIPILIPGGIASTITMDAEPFKQITPDLPPTFAIHFVDDDGRITTHWRSLEMGL